MDPTRSTTRRDLVQAGSLGLLGITLPSLLANAATQGLRPGAARSCIVFFLDGGPAQQDMWDMKPEAPSEIRGPYRPISTYTPGTFVGEHCVRCANITDKFTILRSHSHGDNGHQTGYHYTLTGRRARFGDGQGGASPVDEHYPSLGSIVSRELGPRANIPPYINLPNVMTAGGAGFYGAAYAPFVINTDPVQPDFEVKDLRLAEGVSLDRFDFRRKMLRKIENLQRSANHAHPSQKTSLAAGNPRETVVDSSHVVPSTTQ